MALLAAACAPPPGELVWSGPTMGTTYTVKVSRPPPALSPASGRIAIEEVLAKIDREMSAYRPDSTVSRFNATVSTDWFTVSSDLARVVTSAQQVSERS